jgi:hypothetical protein
MYIFYHSKGKQRTNYFHNNGDISIKVAALGGGIKPADRV